MNKSKLGFIISMLLSGSIGIFVREIPFSSAQVAWVRGFIGGIFILACNLIFTKKISFDKILKNLHILIPAGIALGFNWMLLFEAYKYTTIATATICYYFAPVLIMFVSPILLKERLNIVKVICILVSMLGIIMVSGIGKGGSFTGVIYGLSAAVVYASIVILNKKLKDISGMESGFVQLFVSAVVMGIYIFFTDSFSFPALSTKELIVLLVVGIVHTGILYLLYFSCVQALPSQVSAVFSYIDPVSAIIFSAIFLRENMKSLQLVGGLLVLGATFANEMYASKKEILPK